MSQHCPNIIIEEIVKQTINLLASNDYDCDDTAIAKIIESVKLNLIDKFSTGKESLKRSLDEDTNNDDDEEEDDDKAIKFQKVNNSNDKVDPSLVSIEQDTLVLECEDDDLEITTKQQAIKHVKKEQTDEKKDEQQQAPPDDKKEQTDEKKDENENDNENEEDETDEIPVNDLKSGEVKFHIKNNTGDEIKINTVALEINNDTYQMIMNGNEEKTTVQPGEVFIGKAHIVSEASKENQTIESEQEKEQEQDVGF